MQNQQALKKNFENLLEINGPDTPVYFQKRLIRAVFLLQNKTTDEVERAELKEVSSTLEQLYYLFEVPEYVQKEIEEIKNLSNKKILVEKE